MKIRQFANFPNIKALNIVAVSSLAIGIAASISAAPAQAVLITSGSVQLSDGAFNSLGTINGVGSFSVNFNELNGALVSNIAPTGSFTPLFPVNNTFAERTIGNFTASGIVSPGIYDYTLSNPTGLTFNFGPAGVLTLPSGTGFRGTTIGNNVNFSLSPISSVNSNFFSGGENSRVTVPNFDFSVSPIPDRRGGYNLTIEAAAVPEPFTIIGTIIGGTAAFRMRKKLASKN